MKRPLFFLVGLVSLLLASGQLEDACASCLAASCHEVSTSTKVFTSTLPCDGPVQVFTVTERPPAETITITASQASSSGSVAAAILAAPIVDGFSGVTLQSSPVTSTSPSGQAAFNTAQAEDTGAASGSLQSPMPSGPMLTGSSTGRLADVSLVPTTDVSSAKIAVVPSPTSASSPREPAGPASVSVSDAAFPNIMSGMSVSVQGSPKVDPTDAFRDTILTFVTTTVSTDEVTLGISISNFTATRSGATTALTALSSPGDPSPQQAVTSSNPSFAVSDTTSTNPALGLPTSQVGNPRITIPISAETTGTPVSAASATISSTPASNKSAMSGSDDTLSTAQPTIYLPGPPYQNVTLTMIGSEGRVNAITTTTSEAGNSTTLTGMHLSSAPWTTEGVLNTATANVSITETGLIIPTGAIMSSSVAPYSNSTSFTDGSVPSSDMPALSTGAASASTSESILMPMSTENANSTTDPRPAYTQASTGDADASTTPSSASIASPTGYANATTVLDYSSVSISTAGVSSNRSASLPFSAAETAGANPSMNQNTPSTSELTPALTGTSSSSVPSASISNPMAMETSSTAANLSSTLPPSSAVISAGTSDSSEASPPTITIPLAVNTTAAADPGSRPATISLIPTSPANSTGTSDSSEASSPTMTIPPAVNTTEAADPGSGPAITPLTTTSPSNSSSSSSSSSSYSSAESNNSSTSTIPAPQNTGPSTTESLPGPPLPNTSMSSPTFAFQDPSTGELASASGRSPFSAQFDPKATTAFFTLDAQGRLIYRTTGLASIYIASVSMSEEPVQWAPESALSSGYVPLKCTYTSGKLACAAVGRVVLGTFQFCEDDDVDVTWGLQCPEVVVVEQQVQGEG